MLARICALVCLAGLFTPSLAYAQLKATPYVTGLSSPIAFIQDIADPANQFVVQQGGRIRLVRNGVLQVTDFANLSTSILSGGEQGLLGMALAPDWASSGRFFVYFNNPSGDIVVRRMRRDPGNALRADPAYPFQLDLQWSTGERFIRHPDQSNHNGGNLAFGPDGYLYIGTGDGGSGNDPPNNAQNPGVLLGKMLRIDVSVADGQATGFVVPATNPYPAGTCATVCPEIWDIGLRNPWRWSFDNPARGGTGALIIGDVGQNTREEIDYEPAGVGGRNYGWSIREGLIATPGISGRTPPATFPTLTNPIFDYGRTSGGSTTGGFVYRGTALGAGYVGRYFFGDFVSGHIWSLALTINPSTGNATASDLRDHTTELGGVTSVSAFGVDANGELYFVNYGGTINRIGLAGPSMTLDRTAMGFGMQIANQASVRQTPAQTVRMSQTGAGTVTWTVSSTAPWLVVSPTSGTGPANFTVSVQFASGLSPSQTANLTFAITNGSGPATFPVTLNVFTGASGSPFGQFDTPTNNASNLAGSIAVTGWSIDDIAVSRVRIWRDPVSGETPNALVLIGDAALVEGARPDVVAAYPNMPLSSRAGWGYLLLTNFLPNLGNGTFRIHAFAEDAEGHTTLLGSKTITCANAGSTAPFGAIDTPSQGGTVSGALTNFGWVLSPNPGHADPPHGGTVQIVIDGAVIGTVPSGWTSRSDLTALFPASQYAGITNAVGNALLDTTALSNGVHTIAWVVTDNLGFASGIGSRYFTVSNGSSLRTTQNAAQSTAHSAQSTEHPAPSTVFARRGFDAFAAYEVLEPGADGRITFEINELDRVELWVGPGAGGYSIVAGQPQPLPIGSQLDQDSGRFTWHPGVGFVGTYDLVLNGRAVRIKIGAKP